jgi:CRP-like cAMP-binding protein
MARKLTTQFNLKTFLSKVGSGKTIFKFDKGATIFSQGDAADAVFYVQDGKVKLTVVSQQGKEAVIAILDPASFFGEACLAGETLRIEDLGAAKINALVSVTRLDGEALQAVLGPRRPSFDVPAHARALDVVRGYVTLGVEHILTGPDHLLFVFGLLLLVSASRLLVRTITAFTLGHSITLSVAALGLATVPSRPVEVLIALSVLALAVELARDPGAPTLLRRFPWMMALAFGLLHGFGFAGALAEAGLPPGQIPLALVSFNGGIELGQLAFVAAVLALGALSRRVAPALAPRSTRVAVYAMGILAAYWCFERVAVWLA